MAKTYVEFARYKCILLLIKYHRKISTIQNLKNEYPIAH